LMQLFLVLFQVASGGPARGSELESLSLCNTVEQGQRTILLAEGGKLVATFLSVGKKKASIHHPVPRLLPQEASQVVLSYVLLLRKCHCWFSHILFASGGADDVKKLDVVSNFRQSFLVHKGVKATSDWIRIAFRKVLSDVGHVPLKMSTFRHLAQVLAVELVIPAALGNYQVFQSMSREEILGAWSRVGSVIQLALLPLQEVLMKQAGHSVKTAEMQYGNGLLSSHPQVPFGLMKSFFDASKLWWTLLQPDAGSQLLAASQITSQPSYQGSLLKYSLVCGAGQLSHQYGCRHEAGEVPDDACVKQLLLSLIGVSTFKSLEQESAVTKHLSLARSNFLVVLPTGGGKTLILTAPVLNDVVHHRAVQGVTIVVSPLVSLRNSQVGYLLQLKCFVQPCAMLWQDLRNTPTEMRELLVMPVSQAKCIFLFVTPEACLEESFKDFYASLVVLNRVARIVIDECHNIVTGGLFRQAYSQLSKLIIGKSNKKRRYGNQKKQQQEQIVPFTLLSATVPKGDGEESFQSQLFQSLSGSSDGSNILESIDVIRAPVINRKELSIGVVTCADMIEAEEQCISTVLYFTRPEQQGSVNILVYVWSIESSGRLCEKLSEYSGFEVQFFNGQLGSEEKTKSQDWWFRDNDDSSSSIAAVGAVVRKVMIATTAFGEGLNHSGVSVVIHVGVSYSLINYVQEIGRAARDVRLVPVGYALFLASEKDLARNDFSEVRNMLVQLIDKSCRWQNLGVYFDGAEGVCCQSIGSVLVCDKCWNASDITHWSKNCFASSEERLARVLVVTTQQTEMIEENDAMELEGEEEEEVGGGEEFDDEAADDKFWAAAVTVMEQRTVISKDEKALSNFMLWRAGKVLMCWCCGQDGHKTLTCQSWYGSCFLCGSRDHYRANCKVELPKNGLVCFKCYLPCSHRIGSRKIDCDERVKCVVLKRLKKKFQSEAHFVNWYFSEQTTWKDRLEQIEKCF